MPTFSLLQRAFVCPASRFGCCSLSMAISLDEIRALAQRVAGSHHLDVVDVEFSGGAKFRALRVFVEKDTEGRAQLKAMAENGGVDELPRGVPVEQLSGVTHEDCVQFAQDFGTVLDVEDLIPGAEYTLEVSSPGLERRLHRAEDYARFCGNLVKLQTFTPVSANRHWTGRLVRFSDGVLTLEATAGKQKGKKSAAAQAVEIELANVEKAHLVAEI